jgi:ferrous iron transport protein A
MEMTAATTPLGSSDALIPLPFLRSGESGCVGDVIGTGCLVQRLREMGLRAGAKVQMVRSGSPCILRLDGQTLCIRSDEMSHVLVRI